MTLSTDTNWLASDQGQRVRLEGLETRGVSETNQYLHALEFKARSVADSIAPSILYDGVEQLSSTQTTATSGMIVYVFNNDFSLNSRAVYDTSTTTGLNALLAKLQSLTTEMFIMISAGPYKSNASIDAEMTTLGSQAWKPYTFYTTYDCRFAAFGRGDLGIVNEKLFVEVSGNPRAETNIMINEYDSVGASGYGPAIIFQDSPVNGDYSNSFSPLATGQHVLFACAGYINAAANTITATIKFYNGTPTLLDSTTVTINSVGVYQHIAKYIATPAGTTSITITVSGATNGVLTNIQLYKASVLAPVSDSTVHVQYNGVSNLNLSLSPVAGTPYNNSAWINFVNSNSNLLSGTTFGASTQNHEWGNIILTGNTQIATSTTSGSESISTGAVTTIDPNLPYYVSCWVWVTTKVAGNISLAINSNDTLSTIDGSAITQASIIHSQWTAGDDTGRWILLDGWVLPYSWTAEECTYYANLFNSYFSGISGNPVYGNMTQMSSGTTQLNLIISNTGNSTATNVYIALPTISHVNSAAWGIDHTYALDINPIAQQ